MHRQFIVGIRWLERIVGTGAIANQGLKLIFLGNAFQLSYVIGDDSINTSSNEFPHSLVFIVGPFIDELKSVPSRSQTARVFNGGTQVGAANWILELVPVSVATVRDARFDEQGRNRNRVV